MSDNPYSRENDGAAQAAPRPKSKVPMILGIILGMGVLGVLCCGGLSFFGFKAGMAAMQAPIDEAIRVVSADAELADKLGTPITSTSTMGVTNYQNNNNNGSAEVQFNAQGPKGSANVSGQMTLTAGSWSADQLTVTIDGEETVLPRP